MLGGAANVETLIFCNTFDVQFAITGNVLHAKGYISKRGVERHRGKYEEESNQRAETSLTGPTPDANDPFQYIDFDHGEQEPEPPPQSNGQSPLPPEDHDSSVNPAEGSHLQRCGPAESAPEGRSIDVFGLSQLVLIDKEPTLVSPVDVPYTDSAYTSVFKNAFDRHRSLGPTESDDALTDYSDVSSIADTKRNAYVCELADNLYGKVDIAGQTLHRVKQICEDIPWLLKTLALRIGHNASTQMHRDVMYFAHKHHREISDRFTSLCMDQDLSSQAKHQVAPMPPKEMIEKWQMDLQEPMSDPAADWDFVEDDSGVQPDDDPEEQPKQITDNLYTDFIVCTPAYDWLLDSLRKRPYLMPTDSTHNSSIRKTILSLLRSNHKVSRKAPSETYQMAFLLAWDPLHFTQEQGYVEAAEEVIKYAITLTGSMSQAQAMPCGQYLSHMWPSSGSVVLQMLQDALREPGAIVQANLSDDTKLEGSIDGPHLNVKVSGIRDSIAEVGEQLAWLGSALRSSTDHNLALCSPFIENISNGPEGQTIESSPKIYTCHIQFNTYQHGAHPTMTNGQCWHDMFRNPTLVEGFPILERLENIPGLEIPLNIMAALIHTSRIDVFDETPFIKGISSMLYPTQSLEGFLSWHHLCNKDSSMMSFTDDRIRCRYHVSSLDLQRVRHIVGWCPKVEYHAGSAEAVLSIGKAGLPKTHSGCVLDKVVLSAGNFITGGMEFRLGRKDVPVHISPTGYRSKLQWMARKFVVLWDTGECKGWPVNGNSALLHLTRASLEHNRTDDFSSEFCFRSEDLQESIEPRCPGSSLDVLLKNENRQLPLYREEKDPPRFENRVEDLWNFLYHIAEYQHRAAGQNGIKLRLRPRRHLEGWEFKDLALVRDHIYPRVASIPTIGKSWVDFVRDIQAIVLFGRGFGEVLQPSTNRSPICPHWHTLPPDNYYLAAAVGDLRKIMELDGDASATPPRLSDKIAWNLEDPSPVPFQCKGEDCVKYPGFVQVLLPAKVKSGNSNSKTPSNILPNLQDTCAVVFGHSKVSRLFYPDVGPPKHGDPPSPVEETNGPSDDSGLGTSLGALNLSTSTSNPDASPQAGSDGNSPDLGLPVSSGQSTRSHDRTRCDHTLSSSDAPAEGGQSATGPCYSEVQTGTRNQPNRFTSWAKPILTRASKRRRLQDDE
ncbi:hypothetical protein LTR06_000565 [Exophiala xenobiotica]|nr:hypothetical protein LTR06_000565 [Exophiala xenobiotica]